jgi:hypothetical protein
MKNINKIVLTLAMSWVSFNLAAQVKVGSNPTTLATNAKFQVEGSTGAQTVVLDNGNVGIGTTAPNSKLHIESNTGTRIFINATGGTFSGLRTDLPDAKFFTGTQSNGTNPRYAIIDNINNLERITISAVSGNVGIGVTPEPTKKLDVNGEARIRTLPAGTATDVVVTADVDGNLTKRTATEIVTEGGGITSNIYTADGTWAAGTTRQVTLGDRSTSKLSIAPTGEFANISTLNVIGGFSTGGSNSGITVASNYTDNTNKLGFVKVPQFLNASPPVQAFAMINNVTSNQLMIGGASSTSQANPSEITFRVDGDADLSNNSSSSTVTAMSIKGITGNVGIGSTAPTAKLEVKGAGNTNATTALSILNSADKQLTSVLDDGTLSTGGNFELNQLSVGNRTTTIDLHSVDAVDYSSRLLRAAGANGSLFVRNQGTGNIVLDAENVTGGNELVVNGTTGNIGLGVASPTLKLDVVGNIIARGGEAISNQSGTQLTWNNAALGLSGKSGIVNHRGTGDGGFVFATTNDGTIVNTLLDINNTALNSGIVQSSHGYYSRTTNWYSFAGRYDSFQYHDFQV